MSISENAPQAVRSFVQNCLMVEMPDVRSAPDDETAFNTLIPRSAQALPELQPYLESIQEMVSLARVEASNIVPESSTNSTE